MHVNFIIVSIINLKPLDLINIVSIYIHFPPNRRFEGFRHVPVLYPLHKLHLLQYKVSENSLLKKNCRCLSNLLIFLLFLKSFLAKRGVKEEIQTFDARKISPEIRKGVEDLIRKSKDSFEPAVIFESEIVLYKSLVHYNLIIFL